MIGVISIAAALVFDKGKPIVLLDHMVVRRSVTTHNRLDAVRGAGMSHLTRRP